MGPLNSGVDACFGWKGDRSWVRLERTGEPVRSPKITSDIDTKHPIADILTKGHLTREEWNNLLCLFNMSHFSSLCCAKNFSLTSCTKRIAKKDARTIKSNRIVAKSRPTAMNLISSVATSSSSVNSRIASRSPVILKASSRQVGLSGRPDASTYQNSNPEAASSSQGWQSDAQLFISTVKPVATEYQGCSGNPEVPEDSEESEPKSRIWPHHFRISPDFVPHMEKVFSIVRKIYDPKPTGNLKDHDVNTAIWWYIHVCHTSSCSSSWTRLSTKLTIRQESIFEVCGAIISDN